MPREYKILLGIGLAAIVIGWLLFKFAGTPMTQAPLTDRPGAYTKGNANAPITVTEFADFQCPACQMATPIADQLLSTYPDTVKVVFRHFPLSSHPFAQLGAQAAEAAGAQGKFWEMHDELYSHQNEWGDMTKPLSRSEVIEKFIGYARELKLDEAKFRGDLESNAQGANISSDMDAGTASGVNSTPQFFVGQTMIDNPSYQAISAEIERQRGQ